MGYNVVRIFMKQRKFFSLFFKIFKTFILTQAKKHFIKFTDKRQRDHAISQICFEK